MCEMLVYTNNQRNLSSKELDSKLLKRGDVIVVCDDGWEWSDIELKNTDFIIIKDVKLDKNTAIQMFLQPEIPDIADIDSKTLQSRGFKLDIDSTIITSKNKAVIDNPKRASNVITVENDFDLVSIRAMKNKIISDIKI